MFGDGDMQCYFNHTGSVSPTFGEGTSFCPGKQQRHPPTADKATESSLKRCNEDNMDLDMTCCICLDNFSLGTRKLKQEKAALLVQCGHFYHEKCMSNWINAKDKDQRSCPTCRTEVTYDMEIQILPVDLLVTNRNSIVQLRQKHAFRHKLQRLAEQEPQNRDNASDLEADDDELASTEWVHISLHPMENTDPIAIQHSDTSRRAHRGTRPVSPFTIITADEIPAGSAAETVSRGSSPPSSRSSPQPQHTFSPFEYDDSDNFFLRLENRILSSLPTPYLTPYDNWLTLR